MSITFDFATASTTASENPESARINEAYRQLCFQRDLDRTYRDARQIAIANTIVRVTGWMNYFGCWIMAFMAFYYFVKAVQTNIYPTPPIFFFICFLTVETCGWIYIAKFPQCIAKLK